jgi:hypothetical protein
VVRVRAAVLFVALVASTPARAADPAQQRCNEAYENGQRLRRAGTLRRARDELLVCARDPCPARQQSDCSDWLREVERAIPTVIVVAKVDGREVADVRVFVDGELRKESLDGRAIEADPGAHVVRVEHAGDLPIEVNIVAHESQKDHVVNADFAHARPPEPPPKQEPPPKPKPAPRFERPIPWTVYALGGASALSLGGFALFGAQGTSRLGDLDAQGCKPNCDPSDTDAIKRRFLVADVFLGVAVVAAGVATVLFFTRPTVEAER